ncbi:MAG: proteasome assembly chaperone family protein [Nitrososphaerota archaeon]|nr:proteasome assembly chaperone family protein [Nitrososphaerota archaeon]
MKLQLVEKDRPSLSNVVVICGLPGSGYVGKFAVDHLIDQLKAKPLAEIYSDGFPPQVLVRGDGAISLMRSDLSYWKDPNSKNDLIFFTGDAQPSNPESEFALSEYVVDYLSREFKSSELITLGAYATGMPVEGTKVYAAATDTSLAKALEEIGCTLMAEGGITGMNGLLLGVAKLKGLKGFTLLGETSGYAIDAKASENVILKLEKILGISVDPSKLEERAKQTQMHERARKQVQTQQNSERKRLDYIS